MNTIEPKTIRCTTCGAEFGDSEVGSRCPACGDNGVPCAIADDVTVKINWHELRILGIWATQWAEAKCEESGRRCLAAILRRLRAQHPDKPGLTLMEDIQEAANALGLDMEAHGPQGVKKIKPENQA